MLDCPDEPMIEREEPPPFFSKWGWIYGAVVIYTILIILGLYWITFILNY